MELKHKQRASGMGKICAGVSLEKPRLTKADLDAIETAKKKAEAGKELTENQKTAYTAAINKRDSEPKLPTELTAGQKTHVQNMWYGEKFQFQKVFTSMQTDKGNIVEHPSIKQVFGMLGHKFVSKNEKYFPNKWAHGTPDIIMNSPSCVVDMKNVWEPAGLKWFEQSANEKEKQIQADYEWQIKCYQWLTGKPAGFIIRCLMNPPEQILEKLTYIHFKESGEDKLTDEFRAQVRDLYDFECKHSIQDRISVFRYDLTENDVKIMINQVELMNKEWIKLDQQFQDKNKALEFFKLTA